MGNRFDLLNENAEIMFEDATKFEPYPNERIRMKLHSGEKREQLLESIKKNGILEPVIAMPSTNRGMLITIAGANRVSIAKELGIKVPYQLKTDLTQEQADLICIDTNLLNRQYSEFSVSELAHLLKVKYDIIKHQGKTSIQFEQKLSGEVLGNEYKLSASNIRRYIRLTNLNDDLLQMVDDNTISFNSGVLISFLRKKEQKDLSELLKKNKCNLSLKIADELKVKSQLSDCDIDVLEVINEFSDIDNGEKFKIKKTTYKAIQEIIPKEDIKKIDDILLVAVKQYYGIE